MIKQHSRPNKFTEYFIEKIFRVKAWWIQNVKDWTDSWQVGMLNGNAELKGGIMLKAIQTPAEKH